MPPVGTIAAAFHGTHTTDQPTGRAMPDGLSAPQVATQRIGAYDFALLIR